MSTAGRGEAPAWLLQPEAGLCPCGCIGVRRKTSFVDKTIAGAAGLLGTAMFNDHVAREPGLLQRLDARVKVPCLILLLVAAGLVRHLPLLVVMYAATLPLAAASRISLGFFVKRVWLFIPIFTGIVVIPALFSFITPGHVVLDLGTWFGADVGITEQGLRSAGLIVARVATSISLVVLLTLTTPWTDLLAGLRSLRLPKTFVLVIGMAYRYLFVLVATVGEMFTARKARTLGSDDHGRGGRAFVAASAGVLFGKSAALSDEIHMAMVARGYDGDARALGARPLAARDAAGVAACIAATVLLLLANHAIGG